MAILMMLLCALLMNAGKRFQIAIDRDRRKPLFVRAVQGHGESNNDFIDVSRLGSPLAPAMVQSVDCLAHTTAVHKLPGILGFGLLPGGPSGSRSAVRLACFAPCAAKSLAAVLRPAKRSLNASRSLMRSSMEIPDDGGMSSSSIALLSSLR